MADYTLSAKITGDASGFTKSFQSANKALEDLSSKTKEVGEKVSNFGKGLSDIGANVTAKFTAPVVGAVGYVVKSFADLEQAVGGVETLFKDSANTVIANSETAFKRAGISGVQYMEQVTSFSASLLQGLGGDTVEAAKYADMAIVDMSDNANKMGTDIGAIQNAYQGFAKDNFTMLDNLKLGYGGTASEMARLVNDSGVLGKSFEATAENVKDIPFDQLIKAIHITQTELGITGTTALEAAETVSGSFQSMISAGQNLAAGLGSPTADVQGLITDLQSTVMIFVGNVQRVLGTIWDNLPLEEWQKWTGVIAISIGPVLMILGTLISTIGSLVSTIGLLVSPIGLVVVAIAGLIAIFILFQDEITAAWNSHIKPLFDEFVAIVTRTVQPAFERAFEAIREVVASAFEYIEQVWNNILQPAFEIIIDVVMSEVLPAFEEGFKLISDLVEDAFDIIKQVWNSILKPAFDAIMKNVSKDLLPSFEKAFKAISEAVKVAFELIRTVWNNILHPLIKFVIEVIKHTLLPAFQFVFGAVSTVVSTSFNAISGFWNNTLKPVLTGITDFVSGVFSGNWEKAWNGVVSLFSGIFNGVGDAAKAPLNMVIGMINSVIGGLNSLSIKIPDWVPGFGGQNWGVSIPSIPYLARGTDDWLGGFARINEGGRGELVYMPDGTQVIPHDVSMRYAREAAQASLNIPGGNESNEAKIGGITQNIVINSPKPTSPSENARRMKQSAQQLAMEWG